MGQFTYFAAQMKAESWSYTSGSSSSLGKVSFRAPYSSVVGHVIMRCENFHFRFTSINYVNNIINCNGGFRNVGRQYHLKYKFIIYWKKTLKIFVVTFYLMKVINGGKVISSSFMLKAKPY